MKMSQRTVLSPDYQQLRADVERIPQLFDQQQGTLLYQGRNTIRRFVLEGLPVVAKHYKRPNIFQRLAYTLFRPSKCRRAYDYAAEFRRRGVATPHEIAYIEERRGLFADGYFLCEECTWQNAKLALPDQGDYDVRLAKAVAALAVELHQKGILHGDMNLSNILYRQEGADFRFTLIDINRSRFCDGEPRREACIKNLMRITHRRDLFDLIFRHYARLRGWEEDQTARAGLELLEKFEKRKHIKGIIKKKLKKK